jgi:hypothetical protein
VRAGLFLTAKEFAMSGHDPGSYEPKPDDGGHYFVIAVPPERPENEARDEDTAKALAEFFSILRAEGEL